MSTMQVSPPSTLAREPVQNVPSAERVVSVMIGAALAAYAWKRPGPVGTALAVTGGGALLYRGLSGYCPLYASLMPGHTDDERQLSAANATKDTPSNEPEEAQASITIGASRATLHALLRRPDSLTRIMAHFAELTPAADGGTRWSVQGPLGTHVTWETSMVSEGADQAIRWETRPGATVDHEVRIELAPGPREGTEVKLRVRFAPPGGALGAAVVDHLKVAPRLVAAAALRRLKSLVETGEIPTLEHNPAAR